MSSVSDKAKLFAENFPKNSNLDDSGISLHFFPSRTNLKLHNISVTPNFSVIDGFEWSLMVSLHKNIQVTLEFLKAPFLVLHLFYYTSMTFQMMLSATLLSMLMILLSVLSAIRHLICGNNLNWLLNLNLIYETLDWDRKWLVDFSAGKMQLGSSISYYHVTYEFQSESTL